MWLWHCIYILVKGTIIAANTEAQGAAYNADKKLIFENCAPFTSDIGRIYNT